MSTDNAYGSERQGSAKQCYNEDRIAAWRNDEWHYIGIRAMVQNILNKRLAELSPDDLEKLKIARRAMELDCVGEVWRGCDDPKFQTHQQAQATIFNLSGELVGVDPRCTCYR